MSPARGTRVAGPTDADLQRWVRATYVLRSTERDGLTDPGAVRQRAIEIDPMGLPEADTLVRGLLEKSLATR